jgi:hypothetical protein
MKKLLEALPLRFLLWIACKVSRRCHKHQLIRCMSRLYQMQINCPLPESGTVGLFCCGTRILTELGHFFVEEQQLAYMAAGVCLREQLNR